MGDFMATVLIVVIYAAFISLGIPDSLFGSAWPVIHEEFQLPVSYASFVTLTISAGTVTASFFSAKIIRLLKTGPVTALSTTVTALALFGFSVSPHFLWLFVMAVPLGLGAGAIDAALNNYVALHYKVSHMNFLHCFYGVGVSASPLILSAFLGENASWRSGYRMMFFFQASIALLTILALPVWKKAQARRSEDTGAQELVQADIPFIKLLGSAQVRLSSAVFFGSCTVESVCGIWGTSFLVEVKGFDAGIAARTIGFYYMGIALGRFISGVLSSRVREMTILKIGQVILCGAIASVFLPLPAGMAQAGLFLIGIGNAAVYPIMTHLTPRRFGANQSQSVMGVQMAGANIAFLAMPPLFGLMSNYLGLRIFPLFLAVFFTATVAAQLRLLKGERAPAAR
ncbi:MAG: MFS transporter [Oscillospiraceae bacterium]